MKKILQRANKKLSIGWTAALLSSMSMIAMFLSLFRERLLIANFGVASVELDAYRAAFKVPDFMFIILVSGALSVTFIPVLNERLAKGNKKSAWDMSSSLVNFLASITLVTSVVIMALADPIVTYLLAPGLSPEGQELAIVMMRIIAINPFLFAISSVITSVQQAVGRFFFFALAPAIYSLGIIFGILFLAPRFGIIGVALGVVVGSLAQLLVGSIGMMGLGFEYHNRINWRSRGFRDVLRLLPQRSLDQGIDYFNNLVEISLASRLIRGAINAWEVAFTLHWVPVSLIGVAISTAAFPQMTERISQGRPDLFKKEFIQIFRVLIWLSLPTVVIAFFGRGYIVRLLVAEGNARISDLLGLLAIAIFFRAMFHLISRGFYAQKDTITPLKVSIFAIGLNVFLAIYFVSSWGADIGINGLAIARAIAAVIEVFILLFIMERRFKGIFSLDFFKGVGKMGLATLVSATVTYLGVLNIPLRITDVGFFTLVPKFGTIVLGGLLSYLLASFILNIKEAKPVQDRILKFIYKPIRIQ